MTLEAQSIGPDGTRRSRGSGGTPAGEPSAWIHSWWADLLLFLTAPVLALPLLVTSGLVSWVPATYLAVVTFLAVGHHLPGFLRVYGDPHWMARYRKRLIAGPVAVAAVCVIAAQLELQALTLILLLWGAWHAALQAYGFARIYDAKLGSLAPATIYLDFLMCVSWFGAGLLFSPTRADQILGGYYFAGGPLVPTVWIQAVQLFWGALTAFVTTAFLMNYVAQRRGGQPASLVKLIVLAGNIGWWWFAMVNVSDLLMGILLFELLHAVQYLGLIWIGARRDRRAIGEPVPRWIALAGRGGLLAGVMVVGAACYGLPAFLAGVSPFGMGDGSVHLWGRVIFGLVAASTLWHFYLDGLTWRLRDPWVRDQLGVPDAVASQAKAAWGWVERIPGGLGWGLAAVVLVALGWSQRSGTLPDTRVYASLAEAIPQSWQAHWRLGQALIDEGRVGDAIEVFRLAVEIRPQAVAPRCDLAVALRQQGQITEAIEQLREAIEIAPQSSQAHGELGKTLFGVGMIEDGLKHLETAVALHPDSAAVHLELGLAQAKQGAFQEAIGSLSRAIERDRQLADAYNARGNVHWNLKQLDEAQADFDEAIRLDPNLAKAYRNRAGLALWSADPDQAIADYTQVIALDGRNSRDYVLRGDICYSLGQYEQARDDYARAIRLERRYLEPVERLVGLLTTCPDQSLRDVEQAISLAQAACRQNDWRDGRSLQLLAAAHAAAGDFAEAVRRQQEALDSAPEEISDELLKSMRSRLQEYRQSLAEQPKGSDGPDSP